MRRLSLTAFMLCAALTATTQTTSIPAPFVSRLKAEVNGSAIVLTWIDSPDLDGPVILYRHVEEITRSTFPEARELAVVPHGEETYTDHPPDTRPYYYAAIGTSTDDTRHEIFVNFRNKTLSPRSIEELGAPEDLAATIEGLTAIPGPEGITVRFAVDRQDRTLVLYRSNAPIEGFDDLLGAVPTILDPGITSYVDVPPAGLSYYYAVVDEELVKVGRPEITTGANATLAPARIPLTSTTAQAVSTPTTTERARPLPNLVLGRGVYSGSILSPAFQVPSERPLATQTERAVELLRTGVPRYFFSGKSVQILSIDRGDVGGGDEYLLQEILTEELEQGNLEAAEARLKPFLRVRRNETVEARARFYLGQSLYLQERYSEALLEFLQARRLYYAQVTPWINSCLEWLIRPR